MKALHFFLEMMGVLFIATIAHELYHAATRSTLEIGIRFGQQGGFFVVRGNTSEAIAYCVTAFVMMVGWSVIFKLWRRKPTDS